MKLLPNGYISRYEAAAIIERALFAGKTENSAVRSFRAEGLSAREREARTEAVKTLWRGVDEGYIHAFAVSGGLGQIMRLTPDQTKEVPMLRHPDGGSFDYLRADHEFHGELVDALRKNSGSTGVSAADLSRISLAFPPQEVERYAKRLLRTRRRQERPEGRPRGRPGKLDGVKTIIREIKQDKTWRPTEAIKRLTQLVNRKLPHEEHASETTVARAIDELYAETKDREFQRVRRTPREEQV